MHDREYIFEAMRNQRLLHLTSRGSFFNFPQARKGGIMQNPVGPALFPKKKYLLVFVAEQSNGGGQDDAGHQETGSTPFPPPTYLQTAPANVFYIQKGGGGSLTLAPWTVPSGLEWGWYNQFVYRMSFYYDEIIIGKESLGGADILPGGGGLYPRPDARAVLAATVSAGNARWGAGNYNKMLIHGIGETNALNATNADAWLPATQELIDSDFRANYMDAPVLVIKKGRYQVTDFSAIVSNLWVAQLAYCALNPLKNFLVTGKIPSGGGGWSLQDVTLSDYSHYDDAGSITMGNATADEGLRIHGVSKSQADKPAIISAVVEDSNPDRILITFSKALNPVILPFWMEFTVLPGQRQVVSASISGAVVTLTISEQFYIGQSISISYNKQQYFESCIQDFVGNEADGFTNLAVTNNVSTAVPTYTNVYTSNFTSGVDSWGGSSGGIVTRIASYQGRNNLIGISSSDTTPLAFRSSVFVAGQKYRVGFWVNVPANILVNGNVSEKWSLLVRALSQEITGDLYPLIRRLVLGDTWVYIQRVFTSTQTQLRIEGGYTIGQSTYFTDFVVERIN
jgi:hypothetical protein